MPWAISVKRFRYIAMLVIGAVRRRPSTTSGRMQLYCGYHRDALEGYQRSLEIFSEIGGAQNQAILHHNIGSVHHYKGSYEDGLTACRQALAIYRNIGDLPNEADVLNDIGAIYQSAGCCDEALIHHQKAKIDC